MVVAEFLLITVILPLETELPLADVANIMGSLSWKNSKSFTHYVRFLNEGHDVRIFSRRKNLSAPLTLEFKPQTLRPQNRELSHNQTQSELSFSLSLSLSLSLSPQASEGEGTVQLDGEGYSGVGRPVRWNPNVSTVTFKFRTFSSDALLMYLATDDMVRSHTPPNTHTHTHTDYYI